MNEFAAIDTGLWLAVQKNDYNAFEKLFHQYYSSLCRYSEGFVGDRAQAEDVVQDTFVYFWEKRSRIELKVSLGACLYTAVRYRSLRILENQVRVQRHFPQLSEYIDDLLNTGYSAEEEEKIEKIRAVMQGLPPQCLKVFVMAVLEGKKYSEIASKLSISVNTVKTHMMKAYKILREELKDNESVSMVLLFMVQKCLRFSKLLL